MTPEQIERVRQEAYERGRKRGLTKQQRESVEAVLRMHLAERRSLAS